MASHDSSSVDSHTSDVPPHTFSDNPPHTSDADIVGDIVGPSADNTVNTHNTSTNTEHQELQFIRLMLTVNDVYTL